MSTRPILQEWHDVLRARVRAPLSRWLVHTTGDRPPPGAWLALGAFLLLPLLLQALSAGLSRARRVLVPRKPPMTGVSLHADAPERGGEHR